MQQRLCLLLILALHSLGAEPFEPLVEELKEAHSKVESYLAHYQGTAPGGKSLNAVIVYHGPGQMAALQAEFLLKGDLVAAPLQISSPKHGLILSGERALHLADASLIASELAKAVSFLCSGEENHLTHWSPSLFLTRETAGAQLTYSSKQKLPWNHENWDHSTTGTRQEGKITFETADGATLQIDVSNGILIHQSFPNDEGERTLVLNELMTGLSDEEVDTFIQTLVPKELMKLSYRDHPLFQETQKQSVREIIAHLDEGTLTLPELKERLQESDLPLGNFLRIGYPTAYSLVAPDETWRTAVLAATRSETPIETLRQKMAPKLTAQNLFGTKEFESKSASGREGLALLANKLESLFLALAVEQAIERFSDQPK